MNLVPHVDRGRWSGTEGRQRQPFFANRAAKEPNCPKPKCNGVLQRFSDDTLSCTDCGQIFTRTLIARLT